MLSEKTTSIGKNSSLYFSGSFAERILRTVIDLCKGLSHTDVVLSSSLFSLFTIVACKESNNHGSVFLLHWVGVCYSRKTGAVLCRVGRNQVYNIVMNYQLLSNIEREKDFCFRIIPLHKRDFLNSFVFEILCFPQGLSKGSHTGNLQQ